MTRLAAVCLALAACADPDPAPTSSVRSATPDSLAPDDDRLDDLTITIEYSDADGDLGGGTAEIHDCRSDELVTLLAIPAIAPDDIVDGDAGISGTLDLHVNDVGASTSSALPTACTDLGVSELGANEAVFCVILVDTAGHRGAGDCTATIAIRERENEALRAPRARTSDGYRSSRPTSLEQSSPPSERERERER